MPLVDYGSSSEDESSVLKPSSSIKTNLLTLTKPKVDKSLLQGLESTTTKDKVEGVKPKLKSKLFEVLPQVQPNRLQLDVKKDTKLKLDTQPKLKPTQVFDSVLFPIGEDIVDQYLDSTSIPQSNSSNQLQPKLSGLTYPEPNGSTTNFIPEEALQVLEGTKRRRVKGYHSNSIQLVDVRNPTPQDDLTFQATHNLPTTSNFLAMDLNTNIQANYGARHNIGFLANQAKQLESQLQNDFARQRNLKRESRKKYGW